MLALGGDEPLPHAALPSRACATIRARRARASGARRWRALGGDARGAALAVLVDPGELDATDFVAGIADVAPDLLITGAGASGGEPGCRVFWKDAAQPDACVALVFPRGAAPEPRHDPGLPGGRRSA